MAKNIVSSFWQMLEGYRFKASILIGLSGLSGLLEGVALICLMPIFNVGLVGANPRPSFFEIFHLAWNPENKARMLSYSLGCFFFLGILSAVTKAVSEIGSLQLRTAIELSYRERLTTALMSMRWPEYVSLKMGDIAKGMAQEGQTVGYGAEAIVRLIGLAMVSSCLALLAYGLSPKMTFLTLVFGLLTLLISKRISSATKKHASDFATSSSSLAEKTDQYFSNLKFVKSFGLAPYARRVLSAEQKKCEHDSFRTNLFYPLGRFSFETLGIVFISFIVAFAFWVMPSAFGRIVIFLAVFYRLAPRLMSLQLSYNQLLSVEPWYASWRHRYDFATKCKETLIEGRNEKLDSFKELRFEGVCFSYGSRSVLKDVSFSLTSGKTLALVGESGGGKTTLLDLVTGLIAPTQGNSLLNGIPIQDVALDHWRSKLGLVMQNTPIFHTTVLQNITLGDLHPDLKKAEQCARMAHASEFIERLPGKLDSPLGEKGANLSQGECQRLALARALYRNPLLLILDEATSALDAQSESYILDALKALKGSVTILMVSHRLSTVDFADEILLLSGGEIAERGTYSELLGRTSGDFRKLAKLQGIVD